MPAGAPDKDDDVATMSDDGSASTMSDDGLEVFSADDVEWLEDVMKSSGAYSQWSEEQMQGMLMGLLSLSSGTDRKEEASRLLRARFKSNAIAKQIMAMDYDGQHPTTNIHGTPAHLLYDVYSIVDAVPIKHGVNADVKKGASRAKQSNCAVERQDGIAQYLQKMTDLQNSRDPYRDVSARLQHLSIPFATPSLEAKSWREPDREAFLSCALPALHKIRLITHDPVHVVGFVVGRKHSGAKGDVDHIDMVAYKNHVMMLKPKERVSVVDMSSVEAEMSSTSASVLHLAADGKTIRVRTDKPMRRRSQMVGGARAAAKYAAADDKELEIALDGSSGFWVTGKAWSGPVLLTQRDLAAQPGKTLAVTGVTSLHMLMFLLPTAMTILTANIKGASDVSLQYMMQLLRTDRAGFLTACIMEPELAQLVSEELLKSGAAQMAPADAVSSPSSKKLKNTGDMGKLLEGMEATRVLEYTKITNPDAGSWAHIEVILRSMFLDSCADVELDAHIIRLLKERVDSITANWKGIPAAAKPGAAQSGKRKVGGGASDAKCVATVWDAVSSSYCMDYGHLKDGPTDVLDGKRDCSQIELAQGHCRSLSSAWSKVKEPAPLDVPSSGDKAERWTIDGFDFSREILSEVAVQMAEKRAQDRDAAVLDMRRLVAGQAQLKREMEDLLKIADTLHSAKGSVIPAGRFHLSLSASRANQSLDWQSVESSRQKSAGATESFDDNEHMLFDVDFDSLAHYSRLKSSDPFLKKDDREDIFDPDTAATNTESLTLPSVVADVLRTIFKDDVTSAALQHLVRNVDYYHPVDILHQQIQKQVQLVRLKRSEIKARVKMSGPQLDAFEKDLLDNMRKRSASQYHVNSVCIALALCARYIVAANKHNIPVNLTQRAAECGLVVLASANQALVSSMACIARGIIEATLYVQDIPKDAELSQMINGALETLRRDKGAEDDLPLDPMFANSGESGSSNNIAGAELDDDEWRTFRPRMMFGIGSQSPSNVPAVRVLQKVAGSVEKERPMILSLGGSSKQPSRINACCMQKLNSGFNIHDTLGVKAERFLHHKLKPKSDTIHVLTFHRIGARGSAEVEGIQHREPIQHEHTVKVTLENKMSSSSPSGAPDGVLAARQLINNFKQWAADDVLKAVAGASSAAAFSTSLSQLATKLQDRFSSMSVSLKLTEEEMSDVYRTFVLHEPFMVGAENSAQRGKTFQSIASVTAHFASSMLRTVFGRVACNYKTNPTDEDKTKGKGHHKSSASLWAAKEMHLSEVSKLLSQSESANAFRKKMKEIIRERLPTANFLVLDPKAHDGRGQYVGVLLSSYVAFVTMFDIVDAATQLQVPQTAVKHLILAALNVLRDGFAFNRVDTESDLMSQNLQQLEESKRRKIEIYERLSEEDKNFVREIRKIKDIDWDQLESEMANRQNADVDKLIDEEHESAVLRAQALERGEAGVDEEDNYFMTNTPGEDEDGREEHEYDYEG